MNVANIFKMLLLFCLVLLPLVFLDLGKFWLISVKIHEYDVDAAAICDNLKTKMTKGADVKFFVTFWPEPAWGDAFTYVPFKHVYFSPSVINHKFFPEIVAHELGHIEHNTRNQILADYFAAKIFGLNRILVLRYDLGSIYKKALIKCYNSRATDCPDPTAP